MKPIIFSTDMVRAILAGRKTQTRRVVKPQPTWIEQDKKYRSHPGCWYWCGIPRPDIKDEIVSYAPHQIGDILWVRETWGAYHYDSPDSNASYYTYFADYPDGTKAYEWPEPDEFGEKIICDLPKRRPSIHMPREAARLFLRVTDVRVERLWEITEEDVAREGICHEVRGYNAILIPPRQCFQELWDSLNAKRGYDWDKNPFCWVISFERISKDEALQ